MFRDSHGVVHTVSSSDPLRDLPEGAAAALSSALLRPGEAVHQAREASATAQVDVADALAYRDFMVSDYSDAGQ